jgi:hypothetical protein
MIPYELLKELIINGVRFSYESYDHKKAMEEIKQIQNSGNPVPYGANNMFQFANSCFGVPDEIKQNHRVWRTGRVWQIYFNKDRRMYRFKIGNRYVKNFFLEDFGVKVKPMIFKSEDKYDLIGQGLAVEETI